MKRAVVEAGKPLKRPESVLVVVYTLDGKVLLLQRADDPQFWQSVTGSLEEGEVPLQTAHRELAEETGLNDLELSDCKHSAKFEIRPRWRSRYPEGTTHNLEHVFVTGLPHEVPITLQPDEHLDYCWEPLASAIDRLWSPTNRDALTQFVVPLFN